MEKRPFKFAGQAVHLAGPALKAGDRAPDFRTHRFIKGEGLKAVTLKDALGGKPALFSVLPSLDTPVCSMQTKKFNEQLAALAGKAHSYTVSCDLPFAMNRFCGDPGNNITALTSLSDYYDQSFGRAFGTLIEENKLLSRAVFVVDKDGTVVYSEYVPEAGQEPNYGPALEALTKAAG
jgi:thiol peroxidase